MEKQTVAFRVGEFLREHPGQQFSASEIADHLVDIQDREPVAQVVMAMYILRQSDGDFEVTRKASPHGEGKKRTYARFL